MSNILYFIIIDVSRIELRKHTYYVKVRKKSKTLRYFLLLGRKKKFSSLLLAELISDDTHRCKRTMMNRREGLFPYRCVRVMEYKYERKIKIREIDAAKIFRLNETFYYDD